MKVTCTDVREPIIINTQDQTYKTLLITSIQYIGIYTYCDYFYRFTYYNANECKP